MIFDKPYFMEYDDWYHFDKDKGMYVIEDSAPESAKQSYKEFYESLKYVDKEGDQYGLQEEG